MKLEKDSGSWLLLAGSPWWLVPGKWYTALQGAAASLRWIRTKQLLGIVGAAQMPNVLMMGDNSTGTNSTGTFTPVLLHRYFPT
jgi:hypothetical protein